MDFSCYLCLLIQALGGKKKSRLDRVGPGIEAVRTMNYILTPILCINPVNIQDVTYLCHKCKNECIIAIDKRLNCLRLFLFQTRDS